MSRQYVNFRPMTAALRHEQYERLKKLSDRTRVSQQSLLREAVDDLLKKHARKRRR